MYAIRSWESYFALGLSWWVCSAPLAACTRPACMHTSLALSCSCVQASFVRSCLGSLLAQA